MSNWHEVPRHDPEAERMVLGALLNGAFSEQVTANHFYVPAHEAIFSAYSDLLLHIDKPTQVEIAQQLRQQNLYSADLRDALNEAAGSWIEAENLPYWTERLENARKLRIVRRAYLEAQSLDGAEAVNHIEQAIIQATAAEEEQRLFTGAELAERARARIEERIAHPGKVRGIHLGNDFQRLSEMTYGLQPGDLILVAAATSHGKSTFAQNVAVNVAVEKRHSVVYLNTEMSEEQITDRLLSILASVPADAVVSGVMSKEQRQVLTSRYERLSSSPLVVSDALPDLTPEKAHILLRRYKQQGVELVIVDYVGRMELGLGGKLQEYQVLEQIVKGLKQLAQRLKVAVMVLAQLHEESGFLAGSKRMKNEADMFLKLRPLDEDDDEDRRRLESLKLGLTFNDANYALLLEKNRRGEQGVFIPLWFEKPFLQMWEAWSSKTKEDHEKKRPKGNDPQSS